MDLKVSWPPDLSGIVMDCLWLWSLPQYAGIPSWSSPLQRPWMYCCMQRRKQTKRTRKRRREATTRMTVSACSLTMQSSESASGSPTKWTSSTQAWLISRLVAPSFCQNAHFSLVHISRSNAPFWCKMGASVLRPASRVA